jgi:hydrogenase 3 maturation protease
MAGENHPGTSPISDGEKNVMTKNLVLTVGNGMMGDDAAGPLLAQKINNAPLESWDVVNGGSMPEDYLPLLRKLSPRRVVLVDATDMDLEPGEIRLISEKQIGIPYFMTTHSLPLTFLIQSLLEFVPEVDLIGIQPGVVAFGFPVTSPVKQAVDLLYDGLKQGRWDWQSLESA